MNKFFLILSAAWLASGCARGLDADGRTAVALSADFASADGVSRAATLAEGDAMGIYAQTEGRENYFLKNARWTAAADGHTLVPAAAAYYPDEKQAVVFYAVLPYFSTPTFAVPADQSGAGLKNADLCWGTAASTPVQAPVSVSFRHVLSKLSVSLTGGAIEKITLPGAVVDGALDARTGAFANGSTKNDIWATGSELIAPAQTLNRLVLTSGGVEYVYEGSIALETGKTTSVTLTLHAATKTASLSGSSVSAWTEQTAGGAVGQGVANVLSLHWVPAHPQAASVDKVVLTLKDETSGATADYTVAEGIGWNGDAFEVPFASSSLCYPYTVTGGSIYQGTTLLQSVSLASMFIGPTVYKSGAYSVGVKARNPYNPPSPSDYVQIGALYWTKGNLVAASSTVSDYNGCKVGGQYDGGLYFQFGSLIGWKGGALANGGTGVGANPYTGVSTQYWGGKASWSWANDAMVWPNSMRSKPNAWSPNAGQAAENDAFQKWYFDFSGTSFVGGIDYSAPGSDIRNYTHPTLGALKDGGLAPLGVGDPCTYYLGDLWRLPTLQEHSALFGNVANATVWASVPNWSWTTATYNGALRTGNSFYLPASGVRAHSSGVFGTVTTYGYFWGSTINSNITGYGYAFLNTSAYPSNRYNRSYGFPVRCVSGLSVDVASWTVPTINSVTRTANVSVSDGRAWTAVVTAGGAWLSVSPESGTGNGSFAITCSSTTAGSVRTGNIRVTAGELTFDIPVSQGQNPINVPSATDYILVNGLYWAKGYLVATGTGAGQNNGCKIGGQYDDGLNFQLGSLIGYKNGAQANGGTGVGSLPAAWSATAWGGAAAWSWANDAIVWPKLMNGTPTAWIDDPADDNYTLDYYFSYSVAPWNSLDRPNIQAFDMPFDGDMGVGTLADGRYAAYGVGDPCRYYLGEKWRLPNPADVESLFGGQYINVPPSSVPTASWVTTPFIGIKHSSSGLALVASGGRFSGLYQQKGTNADFQTSTVYKAWRSTSATFWTSYPRSRGRGLAARCVSDAP